MTQTGAIVGTVQYLSPEQAEGHPVDRRADLYSTGIVLYELLTGQVPFDGEAPISIAIKQISEPRYRPAARAGIPPALEAVVMRALEKDPERRFQSADEFVAALENARRAPMRRVVLAEPAASSRRSRARAGGSGRSWRWRWPRSVSGYFLTVGNGDGPEPGRARGERGRPDPRGPRARGAVRDPGVRRCARDKVISRTVGRQEVRKGSTWMRHLARAGERRRCPPSRAITRGRTAGAGGRGLQGQGDKGSRTRWTKAT